SPALAGKHLNSFSITRHDTFTNLLPYTTLFRSYFGDDAAIHIVKNVNGDDANTAPGIHVDAGSTLTFTYVVTNTGNIAIKNVAVIDNVLGSITSFSHDANTNALLYTNETWTFTK